MPMRALLNIPFQTFSPFAVIISSGKASTRTHHVIHARVNYKVILSHRVVSLVCLFIHQRLKYHTQIHVRSTRGRNRVGRKITGIEPLPGENKVPRQS